MSELAQRLAELSIGEPQSVFNLTIVPLMSGQSKAMHYSVLDSALFQGHARIKEVSESGHVPQLLFENLGADPILLVDGEQLVGCKQNRVLNMSILAEGGKETEIPVSCVERGRWRSDSSEFSSSDESSFSAMRMAKMASVSDNLKNFDRAESNQGEVWEHIYAKSMRMGSSSQSEAMSGIYERHREQIRLYIEQVEPRLNQVGAVFAVNGRVLGCELFDQPETFAHYFKKIASGYVLDAIDLRNEADAQVDGSQVIDFLKNLGQAPLFRHAGIGLGENLRLDDPRYVGAALAKDEKILHFCAFPAPAHDQQRRRGPRQLNDL
jgi:hypothetical protein